MFKKLKSESLHYQPEFSRIHTYIGDNWWYISDKLRKQLFYYNRITKEAQSEPPLKENWKHNKISNVYYNEKTKKMMTTPPFLDQSDKSNPIPLSENWWLVEGIDKNQQFYWNRETDQIQIQHPYQTSVSKFSKIKKYIKKHVN